MTEFVRLEECENGEEIFREAVQEIEDMIEREAVEGMTFDDDTLYIGLHTSDGVWRVFRVFKNHPYEWVEYNADVFAYAIDDAIAFWKHPNRKETKELLGEWRREYDGTQNERH